MALSLEQQRQITNNDSAFRDDYDRMMVDWPTGAFQFFWL